MTRKAALTGRPVTIAAAFAAEQPAMMALPAEMFDPAWLPGIAATLAILAAGAWIDAGQPLVLLGDSGTGKPICS